MTESEQHLVNEIENLFRTRTTLRKKVYALELAATTVVETFEVFLRTGRNIEALQAAVEVLRSVK